MGGQTVRVDYSDLVFKAMADPTRRSLLDELRRRNGQTLEELCQPLAMARQSATQHLGVLEAANLATTVRRGREKLHYLNPVPLWDIQERWIEQFESPRLRALSTMKRRAEENTMDSRPSYVYGTYIEASPERVWEALTDPALTETKATTRLQPGVGHDGHHRHEHVGKQDRSRVPGEKLWALISWRTCPTAAPIRNTEAAMMVANQNPCP